MGSGTDSAQGLGKCSGGWPSIGLNDQPSRGSLRFPAEPRREVEFHDRQVSPAKAVAKLAIDGSSQSVNNSIRNHSAVAMIRPSRKGHLGGGLSSDGI